MTDLLDLYNLAETHGTQVYWFDLDEAESLSMPLPDGSCAVAMDPWRLPTAADETVKLAHELGHCETGSFYNRYAACDVRQKHENRANKWAYEKLVPEDELWRAICRGYREPWELAEYFGVTEAFMRGAMDYYQHTCAAF